MYLIKLQQANGPESVESAPKPMDWASQFFIAVPCQFSFRIPYCTSCETSLPTVTANSDPSPTSSPVTVSKLHMKKCDGGACVGYATTGTCRHRLGMQCRTLLHYRNIRKVPRATNTVTNPIKNWLQTHIIELAGNISQI